MNTRDYAVIIFLLVSRNDEINHDKVDLHIDSEHFTADLGDDVEVNCDNALIDNPNENNCTNLEPNACLHFKKNPCHMGTYFSTAKCFKN